MLVHMFKKKNWGGGGEYVQKCIWDLDMSVFDLNLISACVCVPQLLRSSLVNNRTQAKVAEELGMQEFAITNDKTKRPVALRTKTLADLLECTYTVHSPFEYTFATKYIGTLVLF